eukprot:429718-Pelagomonas_calceolata.AAC.4
MQHLDGDQLPAWHLHTSHEQAIFTGGNRGIISNKRTCPLPIGHQSLVAEPDRCMEALTSARSCCAHCSPRACRQSRSCTGQPAVQACERCRVIESNIFGARKEPSPRRATNGMPQTTCINKHAPLNLDTHRSHELEGHHSIDVALGDAQHVHVLMPHGHVRYGSQALHWLGRHRASLAMQYLAAEELCCFPPGAAIKEQQSRTGGWVCVQRKVCAP